MLPAVEAVMLVGGKGTRLRPLTISAPKPMLPAGGVPVTEHQLARVRDAGVDRVVLATSYRAEVFERYFGDGSRLGIDLVYVHEDVPLGTGGGIRNVAERLCSGPDDPVLIFNGDVLAASDLRAQIGLHRSRGAQVTLHLVEVDDPRAFGVVTTDGDGRVREFLEKTPHPPTNRINAGCYVFRRSVIDAIPAGRPVSVERETFPQLLAAGASVHGYVDNSYWLDLGKPSDFVRGSCDLVLGRLPSSALPGPCGQFLALAGAEISPAAELRSGTTVGAGALVGAGAVVDGCVLFDGCRVEMGAQVRDSVVGRGTVVGSECVVAGAVLGDDVRIGCRNELLTGVRVFPGTRLGDVSVRFSSDAS
ncbi:MAG: mannose-1-phosphate guanylyltransferase [Frankiaceae bacterium]